MNNHNNNNSRGGGCGARGGRGGARGRGGGAARGRGGSGAGNGSTISLVTDQPFESLPAEEQDMIKYLHRSSKSSKTSFNAILNTSIPDDDDHAPPVAVAESTTTTAAEGMGNSRNTTTPLVVVSEEEATPTGTIPTLSSVSGFTLPPKRKKRSRDDDDSDDEKGATIDNVESPAVVVPSPEVVVAAPPAQRPTSMIGKWRSQLQALAPPSLPLGWLPSVSYVQSTHTRFLSHRARISAMRMESIEAISYFHDFKKKESRRNHAVADIHIGKKRLASSNNHHKSVSEASGSKYSSVQGDAENSDSEEDGSGDGPSRGTLLKIQNIYDTLMAISSNDDEDGDSRVYELLKSTGGSSGGNPWVRGLSKAQKEDIAAAAASIAVRVPFTLAPLGHALVGVDAEAEQELTDLQVAEDLVPLIGFLPLQQSLMSMWFHCLTQCIGSVVSNNNINNTTTTTAASLPPVLPLMSMFALVGDGDTNNLLHAVLRVVLNGAAGNIGHLPEVDLEVSSTIAEVLPTLTADVPEEEDKDIIRPGKGQLSINNVGDDEDDDDYVVPVTNPMVGADSLREHTAAASVNTLVARTWRRSHHKHNTTIPPSSSKVLLAVDICITSILPTAKFEGVASASRNGDGGEEVVDDALSKLLEGVRYVCQLVPLGFQRSNSASSSAMTTHGVGGWLYTAFAAVELPLDPQGDMLLQRLYRLTLRALHAIRSATVDLDAIVSNLQNTTSPASSSSSTPDHQRWMIVGGLLSMVWAGGADPTTTSTGRSLETLSTMPASQLRAAFSDASAQVVASLETVLIILCKTFVSHNKDLVPI